MFFKRNKYPLSKENIDVLLLFDCFDSAVFSSLLALVNSLGLVLKYAGDDLKEEFGEKGIDYNATHPLYHGDSNDYSKINISLNIVRNPGTLIHVYFKVKLKLFFETPFTDIYEADCFIGCFYSLERFRIVQDYYTYEYYKRYGYSTKDLSIEDHWGEKVLIKGQNPGKTVRFLDVLFQMSAYKIVFKSSLENSLFEFLETSFVDLVERKADGIVELLINEDPLESHHKVYQDVRWRLRKVVLGWQEDNKYLILKEGQKTNKL